MTISVRMAGAADFHTACDRFQFEKELFLVHSEGRYNLTVEQADRLFNIREEPSVLIEERRILGFANHNCLREGRSV